MLAINLDSVFLMSAAFAPGMKQRQWGRIVEGKPIERPERREPTNVVNLMEALRRSVEASGASTSNKAKARPSARRNAPEKSQQPKRKARRRTGEIKSSKVRLRSRVAWAAILPAHAVVRMGVSRRAAGQWLV